MLTPIGLRSTASFFEFFREAGFTHEQFKQEPGAGRPPSKPPRQPAGSPGTHFRALRRCTSCCAGSSWACRWRASPSRGLCRNLMDLPRCWKRECWFATGSRLTPRVMLTPCERFLFAADPARTLESPESSAMVLWPNPSTRLLQMFAILAALPGQPWILAPAAGSSPSSRRITAAGW